MRSHEKPASPGPRQPPSSARDEDLPPEPGPPVGHRRAGPRVLESGTTSRLDGSDRRGVLLEVWPGGSSLRGRGQRQTGLPPAVETAGQRPRAVSLLLK